MARTSYDIVLVFPPIRTWDSPRNFPTGLGLIAAQLRQHGYRVAVVDANGLRLNHAQVIEEICDYDPAVIGIGGLITTYRWSKILCQQLKQTLPDRKIVLGGSVGTSIIETALTKLPIDVITVGEADETIVELMPALLAGADRYDIAGVAYRHEGRIVQTEARPLLTNLDALPHPAWDLFPMDVYLENPVVGVGRDIDIISSRGCPFDCQYCYKIFGRRYRGRSAAHVVDEMRCLKEQYDIDFISFQDDCFVIDKQRVYEICDLIDRTPCLQDVRWSCNGRVTVCDEAMVRRMKDSGCISVAFGIESGSETILQNMRKQAPLDQAREVIQACRRVGVRTPLAFMIGYPGETRATVMETVEFCRSLNIPLSSMSFTCPYPGTGLYKELREQGRLQGDEEELVLRMGDAVDLTVNLTDMADSDLIDLRAEALAMVKDSYRPPTPEQQAEQDRELLGEKLYQKAQQQLQDPRMRAHRQRHGFNDGSAASAGTTQQTHWPGWVDGRIGPYIIAEAGVNHNGELSLALDLVDAAARVGAHCVKFQAFTAEELVTRLAAKAAYQQTCGKSGETQYDMLRRYELSINAFNTIKQRCQQRGIDFLVTPFSTRWVELLTKMGVSAIKIGSGNIGASSLLDTIGQTHLPVILSTGMSHMMEVEQTVQRLRSAGCGPLAVLHCVSLYPTELSQANLRAIALLHQQTGLKAGFSDHTTEIVTGSLAVAAGATILEKHFTLDKDMDGPDHQASLEPEELGQYILQAKQAWSAMGRAQKKPLQDELPVRELVRMSLVANQVIRAGSIITRDMLTTKRPGTGIPEDQLALVIGARAAKDIQPDEILTRQAIQRA